MGLPVVLLKGQLQRHNAISESFLLVATTCICSRRAVRQLSYPEVTLTSRPFRHHLTGHSLRLRHLPLQLHL